MYSLVIFSTLLILAFGRPQDANQISQQPQQLLAKSQQQYGQSTANATIVNKTEETNEDGSFSFSFETSDGVRVQQNGFLKKSDNLSRSSAENAEGDGLIQVLMGGYSYTAPNGEVVQVQYIADENGYQPQGSHIPTPPPIPEGIARSLEQINNAPQQYDQTASVGASPVVSREIPQEVPQEPSLELSQENLAQSAEHHE